MGVRKLVGDMLTKEPPILSCLSHDKNRGPESELTGQGALTLRGRLLVQLTAKMTPKQCQNGSNSLTPIDNC